MKKGVFRCVLLFGNLALKVPRIRNFCMGMRCNRWEREMWQYWRPIFGWENLCPIYFADSLGILVIMPRVQQPITFEDVKIATSGKYDYYPNIILETKPEDWGCLGGRIVALDYGLPKADMVVRRRRTYKDEMLWRQKGRY